MEIITEIALVEAVALLSLLHFPGQCRLPLVIPVDSQVRLNRSVSRYKPALTMLIYVYMAGTQGAIPGPAPLGDPANTLIANEVLTTLLNTITYHFNVEESVAFEFLAPTIRQNLASGCLGQLGQGAVARLEDWLRNDDAIREYNEGVRRGSGRPPVVIPRLRTPSPGSVPFLAGIAREVVPSGTPPRSQRQSRARGPAQTTAMYSRQPQRLSSRDRSPAEGSSTSSLTSGNRRPSMSALFPGTNGQQYDGYQSSVSMPGTPESEPPRGRRRRASPPSRHEEYHA
jgi:hypothetical protein